MPGLEITYFYGQIELEVTFGTTLQNHKLQMPSPNTERYREILKDNERY